MDESGKLFLFSMIVIVNGLFLIYWVLKFLNELKATLRKKKPKLYFFLYLCCNRRRQEKE
jgi:hypothetical protein